MNSQIGLQLHFVACDKKIDEVKKFEMDKKFVLDEELKKTGSSSGRNIYFSTVRVWRIFQDRKSWPLPTYRQRSVHSKRLQL
ncbi:hypothetical protein T02_7533 [Trichinella nativa]|uniref:Uncharacterized protein n=1 Tax=Trichinella nativa TaxID=6335 RepID=A0A0V1KWN7_9BILA|nr:hypothetical protein T06_2001 [Trichinella sp. T6]KRZ51388.1 hypothetical protein T02_7533 [Trichinella nativa]